MCFPSGIIRLSSVRLGWHKTQRRIAQISLHFNCSVFVLSFCQSILLSRDLYLEWVWGKMTMNYKWWSWILFVCSSFYFFKHFMFSWTSSCTPHQNESEKWGVFFFFWKIKWIKYDWSELKTRLWIKCVRATCRYYDFHFVIRQALFTSLNECYTDWTPRTLSTHDGLLKLFFLLSWSLSNPGRGRHYSQSNSGVL